VVNNFRLLRRVFSPLENYDCANKKDINWNDLKMFFSNLLKAFLKILKIFHRQV